MNFYTDAQTSKSPSHDQAATPLKAAVNNGKAPHQCAYSLDSVWMCSARMCLFTQSEWGGPILSYVCHYVMTL